MAKNKRQAATPSPVEPAAERRRDRIVFWLTIVGTIVGTGLSVAAIVASAVQYHEEKLYEIKSERLEQRKNAEIAATKASYEARLRSLEFGLGAKEE